MSAIPSASLDKYVMNHNQIVSGTVQTFLTKMGGTNLVSVKWLITAIVNTMSCALLKAVLLLVHHYLNWLLTQDVTVDNNIAALETCASQDNAGLMFHPVLSLM